MHGIHGMHGMQMQGHEMHNAKCKMKISKLDIFLILCFVTLVVFLVADYRDLGNVHFSCTAIAFIVYLVYLFIEYMGSMTDANSCLFNKYIALPLKMKDMIATEMDNYMTIMKGMKDVMGNNPDEQSINEATFSNDSFDASAFSNLRNEYFAIDKVFRDLRIANSNLYIERIYNPGNALNK